MGIGRVFAKLFLAFLTLVLFASLPSWPYSRRWGYFPSGATCLALLMAIALVLSGYL